MKSRTWFIISVIVVVIAFSSIWFFYKLTNQQSLQTFPATINRDCAPWDGSAFTILIPLKEGVRLAIASYQSPSIKLPVTFSFPDETMMVGNASLLLQDDSIQPLRGKISFQGVEEGIPTKGKFDFFTETGEHLKGRFKAEWGNQIMLCG